MPVSKLLATAILALSFMPVFAMVPQAKPGAFFATPGTIANFQLNETTAVPGRVLNAGNYSITVVDHLSDRMILRIASDAGKDVTTFLALPGESRLASDTNGGPIAMKAGAGSKAALRGFAFPNGSTAQFVYPKDEAVALAKANATTVPAIDPASEGRVDAPKLSRSDLEMVTLWMLTPTAVGADHQPGIAAARYHPERSAPSEAVASTTTPKPVEEASANVPPEAKPHATARPMAALPHTASSLPVIWLVGALCFVGALLLGARRVIGTDIR